jgi:lipid-binding SYLF domain-containing protein
MRQWIGMMVTSLAILAATSVSSPARAAVDAEAIDAGVQSTLQSFYAQNPGNHDLVAKAAGMLVFPRVTKAGLGVGGEGGHGALIVNGSTAGYYKMSGASVGATIGVAHRAEIIVFMTPEALAKFERSAGWTIGADVGVAVASKGTGGDYDSETLRRPVMAFVLGEHGLIADVSLEGTKITKVES